jgi:hypothetical protein
MFIQTQKERELPFCSGLSTVQKARAGAILTPKENYNMHTHTTSLKIYTVY